MDDLKPVECEKEAKLETKTRCNCYRASSSWGNKSFLDKQLKLSNKKLMLL
jgi:hypothetical protein